MATLVSVNVGLPADVDWNGRTVHTAVYKSPVSGPRRVRRLNIDGDGQGDLGGHGGEQRAVLVYQLQSYEYWARVLGRDDLQPGHFGENFTVDGLPDHEVCIGDRYRVGEVVLEVTQPRVTCYRVGLRLGEPQMPALLVSHRRPGFYCRVIEEGSVQAGDEITRIVTGPEQISVADIDALLYLPGHPREDLARALRIPALSPGWQESLRALADAGDGGGNVGLNSAAAASPPAWPGFLALPVTALHRESRDVLSVSLRAPGDVPPWLPGQSVTVRLHPDDITTIVRSYSLSNLPGSDDLRISVKREPHGRAGDYLHSRVEVGDTLDVAAPRGVFVLDDADSPIVLLSAGIGVTPVLAMLHALADQRSTREIWWVHGARNQAEHSFAEEAQRLLNRLPHSHRHISYSDPGAGDSDFDGTGRLSAQILTELGVPTSAEIYLCGPDRFMAEMTAGLGPAHLHAETFGAGAAITPGLAASAPVAPHAPSGPVGAGPGVSFARSSLTVAWDDRFHSLLEFAEACDVPTRWSCRSGVCHTCETVLLAGQVRHDPEPLEPPAPGNVLACCARPTADVVIDL
ncbi:sulfurase [Mycolicibacterium murale]|uniref:Sulfurase n=1 Tax=Mycolicibacterium murale TaxID=182220 RepID=A0A7I9WVV3_9MYCO|nr:MOSC and FAD-binding oxidoreductase domain-containing protein [Mycolicibacterium murale]MCV7185032.1 MOSC domain-containing protein [Mycolicibacterium murale]GFG61811.1 sulfurase [Mycolicibacterium murale]